MRLPDMITSHSSMLIIAFSPSRHEQPDMIWVFMQQVSVTVMMKSKQEKASDKKSVCRWVSQWGLCTRAGIQHRLVV